MVRAAVQVTQPIDPDIHVLQAVEPAPHRRHGVRTSGWRNQVTPMTSVLDDTIA